MLSNMMPGSPALHAASTADATLTVRYCTCSWTWGTAELGHVTEVRRPGGACPTHPPISVASEILGYKIGDRVYDPADVTIIRRGPDAT